MRTEQSPLVHQQDVGSRRVKPFISVSFNWQRPCNFQPVKLQRQLQANRAGGHVLLSPLPCSDVALPHWIYWIFGRVSALQTISILISTLILESFSFHLFCVSVPSGPTDKLDSVSQNNLLHSFYFNSSNGGLNVNHTILQILFTVAFTVEVPL